MDKNRSEKLFMKEIADQFIFVGTEKCREGLVKM